MGGSPSSVKGVLKLKNQIHPHRLSNAILVTVCPAEKDSYDEVSEMLKEHLQKVRDLVRDGVVVNGERRAVRLFFLGDYEALCTFHGHRRGKCNNAMPCVLQYYDCLRVASGLKRAVWDPAGPGVSRRYQSTNG